jgi:hypothetical protein
VTEQKEDEVERLRRMFIAVHESRKEPSRLKKIVSRFRTRKFKSGAKTKKKTDAA